MAVWPIDQTHATHPAHLDVLGAIDGKPSCELVYVDLVAGREHGGATVVQAKAWESRRDVFSVAQLAAGSRPSRHQATRLGSRQTWPPRGTQRNDGSRLGHRHPFTRGAVVPAQGDESMTGAAGCTTT